MSASEALQIFTLGMYDFIVIPKVKKSEALKEIYDLL